MRLDHVILGYMLMWFIYRSAQAEKEAEREAGEPRAKL
jgi:hypothetical protein